MGVLYNKFILTIYCYCTFPIDKSIFFIFYFLAMWQCCETTNHQITCGKLYVKGIFGTSSLLVCVVSVLSADCSGDSDLTMSPEERAPIRRSSTREQDRRSGGTCFLLAASDYTCPADGGLRKTGTSTCTTPCMPFSFNERV